MANITELNTNITGTTNADILIAEESNGGTPDTIDGGGGDDVIFSDHDAVFDDLGAGNGTMGTAINIDFSSNWSTQPNLDVGDDTTPLMMNDQSPICDARFENQKPEFMGCR